MKNIKRFNQFITENLDEKSQNAISSLKGKKIDDYNNLPDLDRYYLDDQDGKYWCLYTADGDHVATVEIENDKVTNVNIK
jgi:hypothetical protein